MSAQVSHAQRRTLLADALWSVAERDGFAAATVRNIAAEAGVSVGMVQHYFSTKDEMLLFALNRVGDELAARITTKIRGLPEPRHPYEVVWIVLSERLPMHARSRVHVQALIAWLGSSAANPDLARYLLEGTQRLRDYLADQIRQAQRSGHVTDTIDALRSADGLLALVDGLSSHVLQGIHSPQAALKILAEHLDHLFGRLETT
jgi:TetR/AcrR family transcriptional regulator, transcriptional repressor of bet genes